MNAKEPAYWCTSSTSFANPAVTIARNLTNTFSGILWTGAPAFMAAQFIGVGAAVLAAKFLAREPSLLKFLTVVILNGFLLFGEMV